jgi:uncharacterized protein DUF3592
VSAEQMGLLLAVLVLAGVGLFFLLYLGVGGRRRLQGWEARAARTAATVMRYETRTYKGNTYHCPVLRFTAGDGTEVVFEAEARRAQDPPVGGSVNVLYAPEDPRVARLPGQGRAGPIFIAVVGAVFLVVAAGLVLVLVRRAV